MQPAPDVRAEPDLLATARRRLPAEVEVIRLSAGLLAGAVAVTGCAPPPEQARAAAASGAHVQEVAADLLGALGEVGRYPLDPEAAWAGCADRGGKVLHQVLARLEPGSRPGPLVEQVRDRLALAGVRLRVVAAGSRDLVTLAGRHQDVEVRVTGYRSRPEVLLDVSGPCLDVGDVASDLLSEPADRLHLASRG